jgi:hypothetical protein
MESKHVNTILIREQDIKLQKYCVIEIVLTKNNLKFGEDNYI